MSVLRSASDRGREAFLLRSWRARSCRWHDAATLGFHQRAAFGFGDGFDTTTSGFVCGSLAFSRSSGVLTRIGRAHFHPGDEIIHHLLRQPLLRRHFEAVVAQRLHDQALIRLARNQRGPDSPPAIISEGASSSSLPPSFFASCRMAFVALLHQHRPDLALKKRALLRRHVRGTSNPGHEKTKAVQEDARRKTAHARREPTLLDAAFLPAEPN
jgi:hypothetical protein